MNHIDSTPVLNCIEVKQDPCHTKKSHNQGPVSLLTHHSTTTQAPVLSSPVHHTQQSVTADDESFHLDLDFDFDLNMQSLHKMLLIYNAVLNGWTVKIGQQPATFEFTKRKNAVKKEILLDNYLEHFTQDNLNFDAILTHKKGKA